MKKNRNTNDEFISSLDNSFRMKTPQWLMDQLREGKNMVILDIREKNAFEKSRIRGSINIPLKELPDFYEKVIPDKSALIACVCNGSVQSAYAIMYLYSQGYTEVYNLSGGISRWQKEELPME